MRRWTISIVMLLAAITAGFAWAISSPPGSSPDEDYHLASIWCPPPVESSGCVVQTAADGNPAIVVNARVFSAAVCYAFHPETSGKCVFGVPTNSVLDERFDRGGYPGGYYRFMHLFVVSDPYTTTYVIREVNVVLTALLGLLLVLAAAPPTRRLMAYAIASTYVPMGMFLVASINPSSWAVVGVTTTAFAFHSYWLAETRPRVLANAGLAAVGVAMSAATRTDAALFAALTALALLVLHFAAARRHLVRLVLPVIVIAVAVADYATSSQASATLTGSGIGQGETGPGWSALLRNAVNLPNLLLGNQGLWNLGWLDTPMPSIVYIPMIVVCAFMLMAGLSQLPLLPVLSLVILTGGTTRPGGPPARAGRMADLDHGLDRQRRRAHGEHQPLHDRHRRTTAPRPGDRVVDARPPGTLADVPRRSRGLRPRRVVGGVDHAPPGDRRACDARTNRATELRTPAIPAGSTAALVSGLVAVPKPLSPAATSPTSSLTSPFSPAHSPEDAK